MLGYRYKFICCWRREGTFTVIDLQFETMYVYTNTERRERERAQKEEKEKKKEGRKILLTQGNIKKNISNKKWREQGMYRNK